ncbi:inorganic phosphate transporter Pho88 [Pilobolus umbonatus]|nr:inorganic phosphate transporter Pho88 [Pilobolus umbonatus]
MGSPSIIQSPIFNMGFLLGTMQLAKKVNWEDPEVITYARIGYYCAQALVIALAYGLIFFIKKKNDTTVFTYTPPAKPSFGSPAPATPEPVTTTIRDYDVDQIKQFIQSSATSIAIISLMHFQFKFTQPLLMQSILPIKNLLTHKVALIHLWGDAPEGALKRPFIVESPFAGITNMLSGGATETPAVTAEAPADNNQSKKNK